MNQKQLEIACGELAEEDEDLALIYRGFGVPPLWDREAGFATLVQIILEQQVSLASVAAAFSKLKERVGVITPPSVIVLSDEEYKAAIFPVKKRVMPTISPGL